MSDDETDRPVAPPPLGGQTPDASLVPPDSGGLQRRDDLALFVGPNPEKFISPVAPANRRWLCWPGFLFPPAWFLYRKMYGWAAFACAVPILAGVLDFGALQRPLMSASSFVGLAGRRIYVVQARRTIARIRAASQGLTEDETRERLARAGGVSTAGGVVGGAIVACAFVIAFVAGYKAQHR